MIFGPAALCILQSPHFAAFDQSDDAVVAFRINVTVCKLRAVGTLLRVAKRLLTSAIHIDTLLNFEVCLVQL